MGRAPTGPEEQTPALGWQSSSPGTQRLLAFHLSAPPSTVVFIRLTCEPEPSALCLTFDPVLHVGGPGSVDRKRGPNPGGPRPVFHAAEDPW